MPVNPQYTARSGANQFMAFAKTMCRLVNVSGPIIRVRYADRPALIAVLDAAEGVCALLPQAVAEQAQEEALTPSQFDPADSTQIPGQTAP